MTLGICIALTLIPTCIFAEGTRCVVRVTVASRIPGSRVPFDPLIDFGALINQAGLAGVLDPNSITVLNVATGAQIPVGVTEDLSYGDRGRIEWVIVDPTHTAYDISFMVVSRRPAREPQKFVPAIGVGDLLRYNAGTPRPIALPSLSRLVDLTGDGKPDLVGCWNYAYRPGWPWDGIVCYPRTGSPSAFEFGDLVRLRFVKTPDATEFQNFASIYMNADLVDLNRDGLIDVVHSPSRGDSLELFLNTGRRDAGAMPIFAAAGRLPRPGKAWEACRAVDLNGDGAIDLVVGDYYLRNTNSDGWPIVPAEPVRLDAGPRASFADLDGDDRMDSVCMEELTTRGPPQGSRVAWKKNLGGNPPRFGPPEPVQDIKEFWCSDVAGATDGTRRGLLVQHNVYQAVSFYEHIGVEQGQPQYRKFGRAESMSAVMSLSDQAWPCLCDWNDDGQLDLLIGGGYGWPRIVLNEGTRDRPVFSEPREILSEGKPIRLVMSDVYPGCDEYKHNLGYSYPVLVDWDGDGLSDLMLPNSSNRLFWYRNVGTRGEPAFGPRQQLNPEGFEDSAEKRAATGRILMSRWEGELEPGQPFFWRTGAAFADFNGDGLMDFVTHDGETRKGTLFVQHRDEGHRLRLRKWGPLKLSDGRLIDDAIVGRKNHWTESFRAVDWDGDGLHDLIYSCAGSDPTGSIYLLRNVGTKAAPQFDLPRTLCCFGEPIRITAHGPHPWAGDFDGDGRADLITCVEWSVYPFYSHAAIEMPQRPTWKLSTVQQRQ